MSFGRTYEELRESRGLPRERDPLDRSGPYLREGTIYAGGMGVPVGSHGIEGTKFELDVSGMTPKEVSVYLEGEAREVAQELGEEGDKRTWFSRRFQMRR